MRKNLHFPKLAYIGGRVIGGRGAGGTVAPHVLVLKNTVIDVYDNTCDISDFEAYIFCPQATQEQPKKRNEAEPPEQLPTDALLQIDYGHTRHCEDCLCQRTTQNTFCEI